MLKDIKKVNKKVKAILSMCPETRNSDKELFREFFKREVDIEFEPWVKNMLFTSIDLLIDTMPAFSSIPRARRELQKEHKELMSDKQIAKAREKEEKDIERYYMGVK